MKGRDPLLGPVRSRDDTGPGRQSHSRRRWSVRRAPWLTLFHIGPFAAVLIGWEHLDVLWPTSVFPDGLTLGASRRVAGLLTIGDPGRPARFETSADLSADWRHWVRDDERQDSSTCIAVPSALRRRLVAAGRPRLGAAGQVQYWVEMDVSSRLGPAMCGSASGVQIMRGLDRIATAQPVPCSRDVFVAHAFRCPIDRRSIVRASETFIDQSDYYPEAARTAGKYGRVKVRVDRDDTGSPLACGVLVSSGSEDLDRQTCKLVGTDPGFTDAAKERRGELATSITQTVNWRLPKD